MNLAIAAVGRDNNFNLIRFVAAFSVLISHSFAVVGGPSAWEPLEATFGYTLGEVAVDVFFASSGFLVTGSLLRLGSIKEFARMRALRIYPGLFVAVCLTAFVLGSTVTTLDLGAYASDLATHTYWARNATLVTGIQHTLPGVFTELPLAGVVNGSLWTLPFEIAAYTALASLWLLCGNSNQSSHRFALILSIALFACLVVFHVLRIEAIQAHHVFRLFFMFVGGALFYSIRQHVRLDWRIGLLLAALLGTSLIESRLFVWLYPLSVAYLTLLLAYAPGRTIRIFNRFGDYSYGIYIYAFPIQQGVLAYFPRASIAELIVLASLLTLGMAIASWHLVEKPWLARKHRRPQDASSARSVDSDCREAKSTGAT